MIDEPITAALAEDLGLTYKFENGHSITVCPPGEASGCHDLRDRGMDLGYEVTCWPHRKTEYGVLSTGGNEPHGLRVRSNVSCAELWMLACLFSHEWEFQAMLEKWQTAPEDTKQQIRVLRFNENLNGRGPTDVLTRSEAYEIAVLVLGGANQG